MRVTSGFVSALKNVALDVAVADACPTVGVVTISMTISGMLHSKSIQRRRRRQRHAASAPAAALQWRACRCIGFPGPASLQPHRAPPRTCAHADLGS
jgi:hypothetical protein